MLMYLIQELEYQRNCELSPPPFNNVAAIPDDAAAISHTSYVCQYPIK